MDSKINEQVLRELIRKAMVEVGRPSLGGTEIAEKAGPGKQGIFSTMGEAIAASKIAQSTLLFQSPQMRKKWAQVIRTACLEPQVLERMSAMAVEETAIGRFEDKLIKNRVAAELTPSVEDLRTEAVSGEKGLTIIEYCPFGVIGAITPTTNPTETIINNAICMISGGNTVVFSPHPRAKNTSIYLVSLLNKALVEAGAPANLITMVEEPSIKATNELMASPEVRLVVATGGPGIVKKVLSSGKKAIGAGPGNPPVVVDETANIEQAAKDIVAGSSFDNNVPCIAEKEVFAVDTIFDYLMLNMKRNGAYELRDEHKIQELWAAVSTSAGEPRAELVGKSAAFLLEKIGIKVTEDTRLIIMETSKEHPFVQTEMLMPILPLVRCTNVDQAIELAHEAEHGNRHSAMMHSTNLAKLSKMAKIMETTIFVKNGPSFSAFGIGGEGYATFTIAGPTGEGLTSPRSFCRKRVCVLKDMFNIR